VPLTGKEYADHWGDFLMGYQWTLFATLTTKYPMTRSRLVSEFERYIRKLARVAQGPLAWQYALEYHSCGAQLHLHALIYAPPCVTPAVARGHWKFGRADVERFDSAKGAAYYIGKTYLRNPDGYDISRRLPPPAAANAQAVALP